MLLRTSHVLMEILAVILASLVLVLVGGAWRLSQGPVSLGFLKTYVATELAEVQGPVSVEFEDLILKWAGWERALDIVAVNTSVKARDGTILASAPEISVSLSATELLVGEFAPTSLELIRPRINLARTENRGFGIGTLPELRGEDSVQFLPMAIDALAGRIDPNSPLSKLRKISVVGAKITVDDTVVGADWGAGYADITISRMADGVHISYDVDADFLGQTHTLRGTIDYRSGDGDILISTQFNKLRPDLLGSQIETLAPLKAVGVTLEGSANFRIAKDGKLKYVTFDISSGAGVLALPHPHLRATKVKSISAAGYADAEQNRLAFKRLAVDLGGPKLDIDGSITQHSDHVDFTVHAVIRALPVNDLGRYWPPDVAGGGHEWIMENIRQGEIANATMNVSGSIDTAGGATKFSKFGATAKIRNTEVHFFRPMPPVRETDMSIVFGRDRIDIQVEHGNLKGISISEGTVALTELAAEDTKLETNLVLRGGLSHALILLNHPKLGYLTKLGFDPSTIKGETAARFSARFLLIKDLNLAQIDIRAAANLADVMAPAVAFGRDLTKGQLALRVDRNSMSVVGQARIDDIPGEIAWYENFSDEARFTRRYDIKTTLDDAARRRFGFDFGESVVGPVFADLSYVEKVKTAPTLYAKLKLDDAAISIPFLKWSKRPGQLGLAELEIGFHNKRMMEIRGYRIAVDGLLSSGSATFAEDGETIEKLTLNSLALGARTNVGGTVERSADGGFTIALNGPQLDLTPFFEDDGNDDGPSRAMALLAHGKFNKLWIGPQTAVANVDVVVRHDGTIWHRVSLNGNIIKGRKFSANYVDDGNAGRLELRAADAGNVIKKLGLFENLHGGNLNLSATRQGSRSEALWRGKLVISNFVLANAPFMARLLTMATLTGSDKGILFNRLEMPFTYGSDKLVIADARAIGSELGITGEGLIDLGKKKIDLDGTIVPAYTINSVLGNFPVLGTVFTGSKGSGVFAATYSMQGDLKKIQFEVNPLAALAPGFLRNLIKGMGKAGTPGPTPGSDIDPASDG